MSCVECVLPGRGLSHPPTPEPMDRPPRPRRAQASEHNSAAAAGRQHPAAAERHNSTLLHTKEEEEEEKEEKECTLHTHAAGCARAKVGKRLQHFVTHLLCYLASLRLQRYTYNTVSLLHCCTCPAQCLQCYSATICVFYHSAWAMGGCRSLGGGSQN